MNPKTQLRRSLSFGAAVLLLGVFLIAIGPKRLLGQLAEVDLWIFSWGLVSVVLALGCWGEATRRLFTAFDTPISRRRTLIAYGAGAFGKQVLPMGNAGGPGVMAYSFDRELELGYSRTLAVIVIAEFLSLVASLLLAMVGIGILLTVASPQAELQLLGVGVVLAGLALLGLSIVVWYRRTNVGLAVAGVARLLEPIIKQVSPAKAVLFQPDRVQSNLRRTYDTLETVAADRRALLYAFAFSQIGWLFFAMPLYTGALALSVRVPLALALFLVPAAGLATVFPLPGGLGGLEMALAGLLAVLAAVDFTTAGTVVILFRLCSYWFYVLICGVGLTVAAVSLGDLSESLSVPDLELKDG